MRNRKSLHQKLDYCVQHGTLKTFSKEEALTNWLGGEQEIDKYYDKGKVLCHFDFFDKEIESTISQLNSPSKFITELIYPILTEYPQ